LLLLFGSLTGLHPFLGSLNFISAGREGRLKTIKALEVPMLTSTAKLLTELDSTEGWPAERWGALLDQTAKVFLGGIERLSAYQIEQFDDVFVQLMHRVDVKSLAKLSQKFSEAKCVLPQVNRRLAFDENESVSTPVLKSRGIAQELLLEVVQSQGLKHRLAIASGQSVDSEVGDALAQCNDRAVHHALVENRGARISEAGWACLVQRGESDRELAGKLARRPDVPVALKRKLHAKREDARMRLLNAMPGVMRDQIEDTIASTGATGTLPDGEPSDLASAQARMLELNRKARLNDSTINRFAVYGEYVEVTAALALLTGSPIEVIRTLIASDKVEGLALACKAARLDWRTAATIVKNRPGVPPVPTRELEKAKEVFESVSLSAAQRTVRF
jgi:uncharacterized protein (DUF2336 family)